MKRFLLFVLLLSPVLSFSQPGQNIQDINAPLDKSEIGYSHQDALENFWSKNIYVISDQSNPEELNKFRGFHLIDLQIYTNSLPGQIKLLADSLRSIRITFMSASGPKDLSAIASLKNLTYLEINGHGATALPDLSGDKQLKTVKFYSSDFSDIQGVTNCPSLESIELYHCDWIRSISFNNPNIREIELSSLEKLKTISGLSNSRLLAHIDYNNLPNLESLGLDSNRSEYTLGLYSIPNSIIKSSSRLNYLKDLSLLVTPGTDISALSKSRSLKKLNLNYASPNPEKLDIDFSGMQLEELTLGSNYVPSNALVSPVDISNISYSKSLKKLTIQGRLLKRGKLGIDFSGMNLQELYLTGSRDIDIGGISACRSLKRLSTDWLSADMDFTKMNLEELDLYNSKQIDVSGISKSNTLKKLVIDGPLSNIDFSGMNLKELDLFGSQEQDLSEVSNSKTLQKLVIRCPFTVSKKINLDFAKLPLTELEIHGYGYPTDISGILESKTLKRLKLVYLPFKTDELEHDINIRTLETLQLDNLAAEGQLSFKNDNQSLKDVSITQCPFIKIQGLENCKLSSLNISQNYWLDEIDGLDKMDVSHIDLKITENYKLSVPKPVLKKCKKCVITKNKELL